MMVSATTTPRPARRVQLPILRRRSTRRTTFIAQDCGHNVHQGDEHDLSRGPLPHQDRRCEGGSQVPLTTPSCYKPVIVGSGNYAGADALPSRLLRFARRASLPPRFESAHKHVRKGVPAHAKASGNLGITPTGAGDPTRRGATITRDGIVNFQQSAYSMSVYSP